MLSSFVNQNEKMDRTESEQSSSNGNKDEETPQKKAPAEAEKNFTVGKIQEEVADLPVANDEAPQ